MAVTLIRHAQTEWNGPPKRFQGRLESDISEEGRIAARVLGRAMGRPSRIVSSPARRCRQTINALFGGADIPTLYDDRLWEMDMGEFSGRLEHEVAAEFPDQWQRWMEAPGRMRVGGGETLREMQARVVAAISDILASASPGESILVVTHGGPIRVLRCLAEDRPLDDYHQMKVLNLSPWRVDGAAHGGSIHVEPLSNLQDAAPPTCG